MRHSKKIRLSLCLALLVAAAACNRNNANPPAGTAGVRVTDVTVGRAIGGDKAITDRTDAFKPNDTMYVSVATEGSSPSATLRRRRCATICGRSSLRARAYVSSVIRLSGVIALMFTPVRRPGASA